MRSFPLLSPLWPVLPVLALGLSLATSGCGKGAKGDCPQLDICGGSPVGNWKVTDACQVSPVRPSQPADTLDFNGMTMPAAPTIAPPQPNAVVGPQTTSGDWCSSLVLNDDGTVSNANLWHDAPPMAADTGPMTESTVLFGPDGSYLTRLVFQEQNSTHFARRCLVAGGATYPTCDLLSTGLNGFYKPASPTVPRTFGGFGDPGDIKCVNATDGGCDCSYTFTIVVNDQGMWKVDDATQTLVQDSTVLTFNGAVMNAAASTTTLRSALCVGPGQPLELSGVSGGSLSNVQGLRTLVLSPM